MIFSQKSAKQIPPFSGSSSEGTIALKTPWGKLIGCAETQSGTLEKRGSAPGNPRGTTALQTLLKKTARGKARGAKPPESHEFVLKLQFVYMIFYR